MLKKLIITIYLITSIITLGQTTDKLQSHIMTKTWKNLLNFEEVTIIQVLPDAIRIRHKSGFATIPIASIPADIQKLLDMSSKKADLYLEQKNKTKLQIELLNKEFIKIERSKIIQIVKDGVILEITAAWDGTWHQGDQLKYLDKNGPDPVFVKFDVKFEDKLVFVRCDTTGLTDGSTYSGVVYNKGTFSYINTLNSLKTISAYTTYKEDIIKN